MASASFCPDDAEEWKCTSPRGWPWPEVHAPHLLKLSRARALGRSTPQSSDDGVGSQQGCHGLRAAVACRAGHNGPLHRGAGDRLRSSPSCRWLWREHAEASPGAWGPSADCSIERRMGRRPRSQVDCAEPESSSRVALPLSVCLNERTVSRRSCGCLARAGRARASNVARWVAGAALTIRLLALAPRASNVAPRVNRRCGNVEEGFALRNAMASCRDECSSSEH